MYVLAVAQRLMHDAPRCATIQKNNMDAKLIGVVAAEGHADASIQKKFFRTMDILPTDKTNSLQVAFTSAPSSRLH